MLSVVVVNWNTREWLRRCLEALQNFPASEATEWIVVDNASADGSAAMVAEEFPQAKLLDMKANLGYAAGNNAGIAASSGDAILTLNPDAIVGPGVLDRCLEFLRWNPALGAVAPRLVDPDTGTAQASVRGFPSLLGLLGAVTGLGRVFPGSAFDSYLLTSFDYGRTQLAPQPMGTFLLFSRSALAAVGDPARPFDERFPIFFNEVDLLFRLAKAGYPCLYAASVEVGHAHGASTRQARKDMVWESHRSLLRYLAKHLRGPRRLAIPLAAAAANVSAFLRTGGVHAGFRA